MREDATFYAEAAAICPDCQRRDDALDAMIWQAGLYPERGFPTDSPFVFFRSTCATLDMSELCVYYSYEDEFIDFLSIREGRQGAHGT
jgi:hypothetical protein